MSDYQQDYQKDELFRAVNDVISILEHVNVNDLAFHLVREAPELTEKLAFCLDCELMESDWNSK